MDFCAYTKSKRIENKEYKKVFFACFLILSPSHSLNSSSPIENWNSFAYINISLIHLTINSNAHFTSFYLTIDILLHKLRESLSCHGIECKWGAFFQLLGCFLKKGDFELIYRLTEGKKEMEFEGNFMSKAILLRDDPSHLITEIF